MDIKTSARSGSILNEPVLGISGLRRSPEYDRRAAESGERWRTRRLKKDGANPRGDWTRAARKGVRGSSDFFFRLTCNLLVVRVRSSLERRHRRRRRRGSKHGRLLAEPRTSLCSLCARRTPGTCNSVTVSLLPASKPIPGAFFPPAVALSRITTGRGETFRHRTSRCRACVRWKHGR